MESLGVNTLQTQCSGQCLISLQDTSKAGDKAIRMTDGRCYYIYAISGYIKSLILRGRNLGDPNFVLPTRVPISVTDLNMLGINPADIRARAAGPMIPMIPMNPMAPRPPARPLRPPGVYDPNRLYIPDGYYLDRDARALRKPTKRKRTKRARKMTKRKK